MCDVAIVVGKGLPELMNFNTYRQFGCAINSFSKGCMLLFTTRTRLLSATGQFERMWLSLSLYLVCKAFSVLSHDSAQLARSYDSIRHPTNFTKNHSFYQRYSMYEKPEIWDTSIRDVVVFFEWKNRRKQWQFWNLCTNDSSMRMHGSTDKTIWAIIRCLVWFISVQFDTILMIKRPKSARTHKKYQKILNTITEYGVWFN